MTPVARAGPATRAEVKRLAARIDRARRALDGSRSADRALCDAQRAVLRRYEDDVRHDGTGDATSPARRRLRGLAVKAMLHLGGDADVWSRSLKDYDHRRYGPYLGVSDEGSASGEIRRAALDSPKVRATRRGAPMIAGVAHDAERLAAIGEVPVGPAEYAGIRLDCTGRILTSTNVGTRLNLRHYKEGPLVTVPGGTVATAVESAREQLERSFKRFLETPDGKPRSLTVFVEFDRKTRRSFADRALILRQLARYVAGGTIAAPDVHTLGFRMRIGFGAPGERGALLAINLARSAGLDQVLIDGVVRKEAGALGTLPGLLNYLPPESVRRVLARAKKAGVRVHPRDLVDTGTVARHAWTSLHAAKSMGLALGKYGTFPLTLEDTDAVVEQVQGWFKDWSAAPVFFVDQGIVSADEVYAGASLMPGLRRWLRMVAKHRVRVVLIDTVEKAKEWQILRDRARPEKGLMSAAQIAAIDRLGTRLGIKVMWAGGITLPQTYEFGRLGVFGIYVTSAAAIPVAVSGEYVNDPHLAAMKEVTYEGVYRTKLLLEAGFLNGRLGGTPLARSLDASARELIAALASSADAGVVKPIEKRLAARTLAAWRRHLRAHRPRAWETRR